MSKQHNTPGDRLADGLNGIRTVWLDEAETAYADGTGGTGKPAGRVSRFLHSGWSVAAACLLTAAVVWGAVMAAGFAGRAPGSVVTPTTDRTQHGHSPTDAQTDYTWAHGEALPAGSLQNASYRMGKILDISRQGRPVGLLYSNHVVTAEVGCFGEEVQSILTAQHFVSARLPGMYDNVTLRMLRLPDVGESLTLSWNTCPVKASVMLYRGDGTLTPIGCPFDVTQTHNGLTLTRGADFPANDEPIMVITVEWLSGEKGLYTCSLGDRDLAWLPEAAEDGLVVCDSLYMAYADGYPGSIVLRTVDTLPKDGVALKQYEEIYTIEEIEHFIAAYGLPVDRIGVRAYENLSGSDDRLTDLFPRETANMTEAERQAFTRDKLAEHEASIRKALGMPTQ